MKTAELKSIEIRIRKLQKEQEQLRKRRRAPVIASIIKSMRDYGITPEQLRAAFAKSPRRGHARTGSNKGARAATPRTPVAPKYRHPESGQSWSGRGRAPRWLAEAEAQGKPRDTFLIPS